MPKLVQPQERPAVLVQVLEYMDGPQAVLLDRSDDRKIVAVAIKKESYRYAFFGAEISFDQWERYRRGFVDLRFLFMFPRWKEWYVFDLVPIKNKVVNLIRAEKDAFAEEYYIPESGFFSYDHSEPIKSTDTIGLATQKYETDGIWDLPDFTEFYHKITDIYVFHLSLRKFVSPHTPIDEKRRIRESFTGHPLRGGSSYVNLYSDLASAQPLGERLSVGRLKYASAGEVDVRGRLDIFAEMTASLTEFGSGYDALREEYNHLHYYLAKNKYLKADAAKFDTGSAVAKFLRTESDKFAQGLKLENPALIYDLTGKNALKYAKILLAHFRRLERYFMFFAEGRVKEPVNIAPKD